jgi:uncharacterized membrane protein HdeD (DUF308 family)
MGKHWTIWMIVGAVAIVGGIVALVDPFSHDIGVEVEALNLALEYFVGWLFSGIGAATALLGWRVGGNLRMRIFPIGVVVLLIGLFFLLDPTAGSTVLKILMALALIASGAMKAILGFEMRPARVAWWTMGAGAISLLVGLLVLIDFPASAGVALAFFLAFDIMATGAMLVVMAIRHRATRL